MQMFDHSVDLTKDIARPFFYVEAMEDQRKTKANGGVPVFYDQVMVRIKIPGSRDEVTRPLEEADKRRWPVQWGQYEKGIKQQLDGVPLAEFATATAAERATLEQMGCQTIEQVAGLGDDVVGRLRLTALKRKADAFVKLRKEMGNTGQLLSEIEALKKRIEELESGKNTEAVVSERDGGDGVQPAVSVSEHDEPKPRRKKADSASK